MQADQVEEQARMLAEQADEQTRHLVKVVQASLSSLRMETQHYANQACESLLTVKCSQLCRLWKVKCSHVARGDEHVMVAAWGP